ncbi:flagellar hook-length control protein FliK [Carnobacterium inhibens]|uniref:flagellar hook-length control protein FliK n=1 Tax=Carnobacterium inhibens TaxID=147709 RepID=UPI0005564F8F|nr:flagellar hook-length control protein FliK [Carnobacterium inhibens]
MNPTPIAPISNGVQKSLDQRQEVKPEEFEAQLAGYLEKEKPNRIHKEKSNSKETAEEDTPEESTDETLSVETPLLYMGWQNQQQATSPANDNLSEQSINEENQMIKSNDSLFLTQLGMEDEKIESMINNEELSSPKLDVSTAPKNSIHLMDVMEEQSIKGSDKTALAETIVLETDPGLSAVKKEVLMVDSLVANGRFLTAEWKSGGNTEQNSAETDEMPDLSLNEKPKMLNESVIIPVETSERTEPVNRVVKVVSPLEQETTETQTNESAELNTIEPIVKEVASTKKIAEHQETYTQVAEIETPVSTVQQQSNVESSSIKPLSTAEPVRQTMVQMVNDVLLEQVETVSSGKQSVARVSLNPERMGNVNIRVEMIDNVLVTKIVVDNLETRELLTTGMHQLTDNLDRQNIRLGELTIQLNENGTADFTSQERQGEEQKSSFGQKMTVSGNESEVMQVEEKRDSGSGRLSILV